MCPPARLRLGPNLRFITLCSATPFAVRTAFPSGTDKGGGDQFLAPAARDERLLALGPGIERTLVEV